MASLLLLLLLLLLQNGYTALLWAVFSGHLDSVRLLLERHSIDANRTNCGIDINHTDTVSGGSRWL